MTTDTDTTDPQTTRRRVLQTTAAAAVATSTVGTASASHDSGFFAGMSGVSGDWNARAFAEGMIDGIVQQLDGDESGAEQNALDAKAEFNEHSGDWVAYANDRDLGGADRQVLEIEFAQSDETYTVFLVADYDESAEEYTSAEMVDSTDREVDHEARLESIAAENAADELQTLHEDYIAPNEDIDADHVQYLAGKYRLGPNTHVTSTLLGDDL